MSIHPALTLLIAQSDLRLETFSGGFRRNRAQFDSSDVVFVLAGFAFVFALIWLVARSSESRARSNSSFGLFWTLAKAHDIRWADRWMLWRIARVKRLAEPALLFLDPRITSPQYMHHLPPQLMARLKAFRRTVFFGIDRIGEEEAGASTLERREPLGLGQSPAELPFSPPGPTLPIAPTGELAEVLGAIRAFSLQDQLVPKRDPPGQPPADEPKQPAPPSPEFPAAQAPVLDLYPWLGNDWEITNADQRHPYRPQ